MDFLEFKNKYQKVPVEEYPNNRKDKYPLVTIKVVTYNHGDFIGQCLDSLVSQKTNFDFEILLAEDDSNDNTREICKNYADKYPNLIRLFLNSRENNIAINGKPTGIFNNAYINYQLRSKYVCILEGDDYWTDECALQKRVNFLEDNEDYVLCFHNISTLEDGLLKHPDGLLRYKERVTISQENMINTYMPTNTLMFRNGYLSAFEEGIKNIVCWDMITRGKLSQFGKAMFLPEVGNSVYRKHEGGIFSSQSISFRVEHALKANQYLSNFFNQKKMDTTNANKSWVEGHIIHFMNEFKETKKINVNLLKRGISKAKDLEISFGKVVFNYAVSRFNMIALKKF